MTGLSTPELRTKKLNVLFTRVPARQNGTKKKNETCCVCGVRQGGSQSTGHRTAQRVQWLSVFTGHCGGKPLPLRLVVDVSWPLTRGQSLDKHRDGCVSLIAQRVRPVQKVVKVLKRAGWDLPASSVEKWFEFSGRTGSVGRTSISKVIKYTQSNWVFPK